MTTVYWQDSETGSLMAAPKENVLLPEGVKLLTKEEWDGLVEVAKQNFENKKNEALDALNAEAIEVYTDLLESGVPERSARRMAYQISSVVELPTAGKGNKGRGGA